MSRTPCFIPHIDEKTEKAVTLLQEQQRQLIKRYTEDIVAPPAFLARMRQDAFFEAISSQEYKDLGTAIMKLHMCNVTPCVAIQLENDNEQEASGCHDGEHGGKQP